MAYKDIERRRRTRKAYRLVLKERRILQFGLPKPRPKMSDKERFRRINLYNQTRDDGLFNKFLSMKRRCNCKSQVGYRWYGARGIKVLWDSYDNFKNDMYDSYLEHLKEYGHKDTTLDRLNPNDNYYKENCRWATRTEQLKFNRQKSKRSI